MLDQERQAAFQKLHNDIAAKLEEIRDLFSRQKDLRLTLVVRMPWLDDGGVLVSDDDAAAAIAELQRLAAKAATIQAKAAPASAPAEEGGDRG